MTTRYGVTMKFKSSGSRSVYSWLLRFWSTFNLTMRMTILVFYLHLKQYPFKLFKDLLFNSNFELNNTWKVLYLKEIKTSWMLTLHLSTVVTWLSLYTTTFQITSVWEYEGKFLCPSLTDRGELAYLFTSSGLSTDCRDWKKFLFGCQKKSRREGGVVKIWTAWYRDRGGVVTTGRGCGGFCEVEWFRLCVKILD